MPTCRRTSAAPRQAARALEAAGYDGAWIVETQHEPFLQLLQTAQQTRRVTVGSAVAIAFARSPMTVANAGYDLAQYAEGRFVLGLGSQVKPHIERRFSMPWGHPAARMREFVVAMRAIWDCWQNGTKLDFTGDFYTHTLMTPFFSPAAHQWPPVYLAGVGDRMTEVAGEVCDGFFFHAFTTDRYLRDVTLPALARGRARNTATLPHIAIAGPAFTCVGRDERALSIAIAGTKQQIAFYASAPAYRAVLELHGWDDAQTELTSLSKAGRWIEMGNLIDDDMLHAFAAVGTPSEVADTLTKRWAGLATRITLYATYESEPSLWVEALDRQADRSSILESVTLLSQFGRRGMLTAWTRAIPPRQKMGNTFLRWEPQNKSGDPGEDLVGRRRSSCEIRQRLLTRRLGIARRAYRAAQWIPSVEPADFAPDLRAPPRQSFGGTVAGHARRKRPLAVFEHGTRIYAPTPSEVPQRYRVVAMDATGRRHFRKCVDEEDARFKARELEAFLSTQTQVSPECGPRTVSTLAEAYLAHIESKSRSYYTRQEYLLRRWVIPKLGATPLTSWTPLASEEVLNNARNHIAPATINTLGSCLRSLVTYAHKARWLPRQMDPMWNVRYTTKPVHQGQALGYVPRESLPNDLQCQALFRALEQQGQATWALAMQLKHRSGLRWGELTALRPSDVQFEPLRQIQVVRSVERVRPGLGVKLPKNNQQRTTIFPASQAQQLGAHAESVRHRHGDNGLLFPGPNGRFAEGAAFGRHWHRAARSAGWPLKLNSDTITIWHPHDLRHVAACWMLFDLKLDPAHVAAMLGHANAAFTLSRYVGIRTGTDQRTNDLTDKW